MKTFSRIIALCIPALLAGCYSMDVSSAKSLDKVTIAPGDDKPLEHVVVSNYGWFLFNAFPLVCGNATPGESFPWKFFSNQVSSELLHDRLTAHAAAINADIRDLVFIRDEKVFILNLPGIEIPIPYLCTYKEMQFSAVLAEKKAPVKKEPLKDVHKESVREMNELLNSLNPEADR